MLVETYMSLLKRDLVKLKQELMEYKNQDKIWYVENGVTNSAGNLSLHLIGNLNHFIGATLGNTGYVRNRDAEFSLKNVPTSELVKQIDETISVIEKSLGKLTDEVLDEDFPLLYADQKISTNHMLVHLISHLNYHLGQVNYYRRLLDK
jgi:uncharacterized damage-inducible protein DinB